ncbi:MAG: hypothetical protein ABII93_05715 [Chrysiogenia bacterium]
MKQSRKIKYSQAVAYAARLPHDCYGKFLKDVTLRRRVLSGEVRIKRSGPVTLVIVRTPGSKSGRT